MSQTITGISADPVVDRTAMLIERIFPQPRAFRVRLWDGTELPASGNSSFTLVLNHPGALRRMFTPPIELSLGESFILNDFDFEGDIFSVFPVIEPMFAHAFPTRELLGIGVGLLALPASDGARALGRGPAQLSGQVHSRERDRAAIQYHYDVGNDFYSLWLDRNLQYSCGYFPT